MNRDWSIWLLLAAGLIAVTGTGVYTMSRGIRNNNPGNIRHGDDWKGMSPVQTDSEFVQFESPIFGIRAMARILKNYQRRHGLKTIREIISRWAPPNENDTAAYVSHVSRALGIPPDAEIDVNQVMVPLVEVIIKHENGRQPYQREEVVAGIRLA